MYGCVYAPGACVRAHAGAQDSDQFLSCFSSSRKKVVKNKNVARVSVYKFVIDHFFRRRDT